MHKDTTSQIQPKLDTDQQSAPPPPHSHQPHEHMSHHQSSSLTGGLSHPSSHPSQSGGGGGYPLDMHSDSMMRAMPPQQPDPHMDHMGHIANGQHFNHPFSITNLMSAQAAAAASDPNKMDMSKMYEQMAAA